MAKISVGQEANKCPIKLRAAGWISSHRPGTTAPPQRTYPVSSIVAIVAPVFSLHLNGHAPGEPESAPPLLRQQATAAGALAQHHGGKNLAIEESTPLKQAVPLSE